MPDGKTDRFEQLLLGVPRQPSEGPLWALAAVGRRANSYSLRRQEARVSAFRLMSGVPQQLDPFYPQTSTAAGCLNAVRASAALSVAPFGPIM